VPVSDRQIKHSLLFRNVVNHPSVAFRRSAITSLGSYENLPWFEDYHLWLKVRQAGLVFGSTNLPLVFMRRPMVLARRSGFHYAVAELRFLTSCLRARLLPFWILPLFALRFFSRLLPLPIQILQDYLPWRSRKLRCANPDSLSVFDRRNLLYSDSHVSDEPCY
jgi:hypothetical protein